MSELLLKIFIKDYKNTTNKKIREKYGILSGGVGIFVNIVLATIKLIIGTFSGSISITADAVNNFSDAGSSVITLIGFKMSGKPADYDHPFGHGRIEYIAGLIVSFIVLLFGFELLKSSAQRIFEPVPIVFSLWAIIALSFSILGKIWLAFFNRHLGKAIKSPTMSAAVADSFSDCGATLVTIISMLLSKFAGINIDAYLGILVAIIIIIAGINIIKDTINPLLGQSPDPKLVSDIEKHIMSYNKIIGIHDLIIHNYGSIKVLGSVHVEVSADENVLEVHAIMDKLEKEIKEKFDVELVAHTDPIETDNAIVKERKKMTLSVINEISPMISMHDFRIVSGPNHTNLIFDIVLPYNLKITENEIKEIINQKIIEIDNSCSCVITVDRDYLGRI